MAQTKARGQPLRWDPQPMCYQADKVESNYIDPVGFTTSLFAGTKNTGYCVEKILGEDGRAQNRVGGDQSIFWLSRGPGGERIADPDRGDHLMYRGADGLRRARELCETTYRPVPTRA